MGIEATQESADVQSDIRVLARGTGITAVGTILGRLIHLGTDIMLARLLGPASFGIYSIAWNLHRLLGNFVSLGVPTGTIAFGVKYWKKDTARLRGVFEAGMFAVLISSSLTALIAWLTADWLSVFVFGKPETAQVIRTVGLVMPFMMVLFNASAMTQITRRMQFSIISGEIISTTAKLTTFAILYWITHQFWAVLASMIVSYALAGCTAIFFVYRLFPELQHNTRSMWLPSMRELLAFSIPTMLAGAMGTGSLWFNRLLAGVFFPIEQVGLYQAASQFNNFFAILLGSVVAVFMPIIAQLHESGEKKRLNELYKITTKWSLYINLPVVLVALLLPRDVMHFFYGPEFTKGSGLLVIITIGQLVNVGTGATGGLFLMTGRQRDLFILTLISSIISLIGSLVLIPSMGISAMAIGLLLSSLCKNLLGTLWLARNSGLWPYDIRYLKGLLAAIITGSIIWWIPVPPVNQMIILILRSGLGLISFVGVLLLLRLDTEDREFLAELWHFFSERFLYPKAEVLND